MFITRELEEKVHLHFKILYDYKETSKFIYFKLEKEACLTNLTTTQGYI